MPLKFVYALISGRNDYYAEQAAASMHSLRTHNTEAHISLVTDDDTLKSLTGNRSLIKKYVNEYILLNPPATFTPKQKSRFLKTSLRQNVDGDFLYLDNDTIVTASLLELEKSDCEIGAVLDHHHTAESNGQLNNYFKKTKKKWDYDRYFNGGIILVRDTAGAYGLFEDWHRIWNDERVRYGISMDQPALAQANILNNCIVTELNGHYNCQIVLPESKRYWLGALIVHYMTDLSDCPPFPLKCTRLLDMIRSEGITAEVEDILLNPVAAYLESTYILGGKELEIYNSPLVVLGRKLSHDCGWLNNVLKFIRGVFRTRL